ncbi:hypothetical protein HDU82_006475 [Entophlyctis luteolus]|nr:hypothetical protein HDU82_006475 [Entophlyctis luteolus]
MRADSLAAIARLDADTVSQTKELAQRVARTFESNHKLFAATGKHLLSRLSSPQVANHQESVLQIQSAISTIKTVNCTAFLKSLSLSTPVSNLADLETYNYAISACAVDADSDGALQIVKHMMEKCSLRPDALTFAHIIKASRLKNRESQVWFDTYRNSDVETNEAPYLSMMEAHICHGDLQSAIDILFTAMAEDDVTFNKKHLAAFFSCLAGYSRHHDVLEWFSRISSDTSSRFPAITESVLGVVFQSAIALGDLSFADKVFTSYTALLTDRASVNTLAMSEYGLAKLEKDEIQVAAKVFSLLESNPDLLIPPLSKFFDSVLCLPSRKRAIFENGHDIESFGKSVFLTMTHYSFPIDILQRTTLRAMQYNEVLSEKLLLFSAASALFSLSDSCKVHLLEAMMKDQTTSESDFARFTERDFRSLLEVAKTSKDFNHLVRMMESRGFKVTEEVCSDIINRLEGKPNKFVWVKLMRKMGVLSGGLLPGETWTLGEFDAASIYIEKQCESGGNIEIALAKLHEMLSSSWHPRWSTVRVLIGELFATERFEEIDHVVSKLRSAESLKKGKASSNSAKDLLRNVNGLLIEQWCKAGNFEKAKTELAIFVENYQRLPKNCGQILNEVYNRMTDLIPNAEVSKDVINDLANSRELQSSAEFIRTVGGIAESSQSLSFASYAPMLLWAEAFLNNTSVAMNLYEKLNASKIPVPPRVHWRLLISAVFAKDTAMAVGLLDDAVERKSRDKLFVLDHNWLRPVIELLLESEQGLKRAKGLLEQLRGSNLDIHLDKESYLLLIDVYMKSNDRDGAADLMLEMQRAFPNSRVVPEEHLGWLFDHLSSKKKLVSRDTVFPVCQIYAHAESITPRETMESIMSIAIVKGCFSDDLAGLFRRIVKDYSCLSNASLANQLIILFGDRNRLQLAFVVLTKFGDEKIFDMAQEILNTDGISAEDIGLIMDGVAMIRSRKTGN